MEERTATILDHLISEYIEAAHPIGSEYLLRRRRLPFSSATIRAILHDLEEAGYITHPHTSAGRIPTDKGYRYYVNSQPSRLLSLKEAEQFKDELVATIEKMEDASQAVPRVLSHFTRTLTVSIDPEQGLLYDAGLAEVVEESDTLETVREISRLRAALDEVLPEVLTNMPDKVHVFIGQENPLVKTHHISCIVRPVTLPGGEEVVLMMVGPKRMSYSRNMSFIEHMVHLFNELPQ